MQPEARAIKFCELSPTRWVFLFGLWGIITGCVSTNIPYNPEETGLELGCAVGDVTSNEATVWIKVVGSQAVAVQYGPKRSPDSMFKTSFVSPAANSDFTVKINLTGLTPKTPYLYRAVVEGKQPGRLCQFVTAPISSDAVPVTFVIGGDLRESFRPFIIMDAMRKAKPDFFILLGDTIYADKGKAAIQLADYWAKYIENRDDATQRFLSETSVFVMWDDHEVDNDFSSTHPRMPIGRKAFMDYWPIRPDQKDPHRLYRSFRWGQAVELFLLDTRQYRDQSARTMLGGVQKEWLKTRLGTSRATIKFIVTSVPFSDPRVDKWGEYSLERDEILDFIGKKEISGVVFLATDVHHAGIAKVPGSLGLKEFIFGPLATAMNDKINRNEPRFEYFDDQSQNYGRISVRPGHFNTFVEVEWVDRFHNPLHRVEFYKDSSKRRLLSKPVK